VYASLLRRYQALVWDSLIYLGALTAALFVPVILGLGTAWTRIASGAFLGFLLLYDPLLVGLRGGTLGHYRYRIRVIDANSDGPIGVPRAFLRAAVKALLGLFSLIFMLVTSRAQSLHDLTARSLVVPLNPGSVAALDVVHPPSLPEASLPSRLHRTLVILAYSSLVLLAFNLGILFVLSKECLDYNACSTADRLRADAVGLLWLVATAIILVYGWRGRLPGGRRRHIARPIVG
jgi:uncharacterized RDD family membrane protein YckC